MQEATRRAVRSRTARIPVQLKPDTPGCSSRPSGFPEVVQTRPESPKPALRRCPRRRAVRARRRGARTGRPLPPRDPQAHQSSPAASGSGSRSPEPGALQARAAACEMTCSRPGRRRWARGRAARERCRCARRGDACRCCRRRALSWPGRWAWARFATDNADLDRLARYHHVCRALRSSTSSPSRSASLSRLLPTRATSASIRPVAIRCAQ